MAVSLPLQTISRAYARHRHRLPPAANLLLVALIAASIAQLVWTLAPLPEAARWRPAPVQASASAPAGRSFNVETLLSARLFGLYQPAGNASVDIENAPDTRLNLTLLGILSGRGERDSRALIASDSGEKPYRIGDDIARGVTLQAIFPDRVILLRNGKAETLRLNKDQPSKASVGPAIERAAASSGVGATLSEVRDQLLQDPSKASEYIRVQPASQNGQLRGYRLYPGRDRELFNNVGLRPGDVVTAVNGIELDNAQKALQMLNDLSQASNFALTIDRGGQVQTVNVSLN